MKKTQQISSFVGLSHLGLVTSAVWASLGREVIAVDSDSLIVSTLKKGKLPLYEPGLDELFKKVYRRYRPTIDYSQIEKASFVFFAQDTATDGTGSVAELNKSIEKTIPHLKDGVIIILMSQVPVGFNRDFSDLIKKSRPALRFSLYHWVDTIIMTNAISCFRHPDRIIIGKDKSTDPLTPELVKALMIFKCPVIYMSWESAELTKASINLYLATSVTFANTLADYSEVTGANINEIIPALRSDKRIGPYAYLRPSLGIAGGHLERDIAMLGRLAKKNKITSGIVKHVRDLNEKRYTWAERQLNQYLQPHCNTQHQVCIWGLSYKKNSTSTQNAPSLKIIQKLSKKYRFTAYDPMAIIPPGLKINRFKDMYKAAKGSDCVLLITDWGEFLKVDFKKLSGLVRNKLIIDSTGILNNSHVGKTFVYKGMGVGEVLRS